MNWIEELEKEMISQMRKADVYFVNPGGYTVSHTYEVYNPETHELVEKKDAKIKRLKDEIAKEKQRVQTCKTVIDAYASNIKEAEDNINKLNKELSELES